MLTRVFAWALVINLVGDTVYAEPMNVTATVVDTCQFGAITDVNFGTISGLFLSTVSTSSGSIAITCTPTSDYLLSIDDGANADATSRRMTDGTDFIDYSLFQDMTFNTPWGDGVAFGDPLADTGTGLARTFTVYATIPSGQTPVEPGSYSDTVVVSFSF